MGALPTRGVVVVDAALEQHADLRKVYGLTVWLLEADFARKKLGGLAWSLSLIHI